MDRVAVFVDAGYLFAQGSAAVAGAKLQRTQLNIDAKAAIAEFRQVCRLTSPKCELLRVYWYDGAISSRPTLEQEQLAQLDDVKVRLGFVNSVGQQKGVDSLIVTDLIELARLGAIRDAVLMSGDEDVRIGVQIAQNYGVRVHIAGIVPSRGSQSKALLHEADTTLEWPKATIEKFLSVRSTPMPSSLVETSSTATPPVVVAPVTTPVSQATALTKLESIAFEFASNLGAADISSLHVYWGTQRGIPPEFDGKLLAIGRAGLGRDLTMDEKRSLRAKFKDVVKARP